jgi:hypothetical protein
MPAAHDFIGGFNQAAAGGRAVDGIESLVGGASGGFFNYRFAQPGRTMRQHIGRWYPERQFPFANQVTRDPVTGETDGVLARCSRSATCPKIFEINSETEYWNKAASLLTTDTQGNDLDLVATPNVRYYLLSSLRTPKLGTGTCQQPQPLPDPVARALLIPLDQWVATCRANQVPRHHDSTLCRAASGVGFGDPKVTYNGRTTTGDCSTSDPSSTGHPDDAAARDREGACPVFVRDRTPTTATSASASPGSPSRCDLLGVVALRLSPATTCAERPEDLVPGEEDRSIVTGDPQLSVQERYPTHAGYVVRVAQRSELRRPAACSPRT